jgi:hypothetical protein
VVVQSRMNIQEEKKEIIKNLYLSGMPEEFIAMQMDLEIPVIIDILREIGVNEMSKQS